MNLAINYPQSHTERQEGARNRLLSPIAGLLTDLSCEYFEREAGISWLLSDLPDDHPAIRFAKRANPFFGGSGAVHPRSSQTVPRVTIHITNSSFKVMSA